MAALSPVTTGESVAFLIIGAALSPRQGEQEPIAGLKPTLQAPRSRSNTLGCASGLTPERPAH